MKLAIIGSRSADKPEHYQLLKDTLAKVQTPITLIISGGAAGADSLAQAYAMEMGLPILIHYPNHARDGDRSFAIRNQQIINDCQNVICLWDFSSPGSRMSLDMAAKANKKTFIIRI